MWTAEVVFPTPPFALVQVMIIARTHAMFALYGSKAPLSIYEKLTLQHFELAKCHLGESVNSLALQSFSSSVVCTFNPYPCRETQITPTMGLRITPDYCLSQFDESN